MLPSLPHYAFVRFDTESYLYSSLIFMALGASNASRGCIARGPAVFVTGVISLIHSAAPFALHICTFANYTDKTSKQLEPEASSAV